MEVKGDRFRQLFLSHPYVLFPGSIGEPGFRQKPFTQLEGKKFTEILSAKKVIGVANRSVPPLCGVEPQTACDVRFTSHSIRRQGSRVFLGEE